MSKIICDVCGSAYSDTASQCPICGTAKRDDYTASAESEQKAAEGGYTYVKGGRFSHANVRKHNSGKTLTRKPADRAPEHSASSMPPLVIADAVTPKSEQNPESEKKPEKKPEKKAERKPTPKPERKAPPKQVDPPAPKKELEPDDMSRSTNIILIIIVLVLLLAVIFAGIYVVRHYKDLFKPEEPASTGSSQQNQPTIDGVRIPCKNIILPGLDTLENDGTPMELDVEFDPATTTDEKTFTSSDPSVATVDQSGVITIVSTGQVTITVTCGEQSAELVLNCVLVLPTEPSQPTEPTEPEGELRLVNAKGQIAEDVTFNKYGEEYQLYAGDIDASLVTFTSSDPAIVTVDANGKIKIVGTGIATITAECGSKKAECKIICTQVEVPVETQYKIKFSGEDPTLGDVTIKVGEKQTIQLLDRESGAPVSDVTWYTSMEGYISLEVTATGVRVTGTDVTVGVKGVGYVRVMCDYEGVTYTCIVRVKAQPTEES